MAKLFADLEFTRLHQQTTIISLGLISEDGQQQFYAEFTDYAKDQVDEWLQENILSQLLFQDRQNNFIQRTNGLTEAKGDISYIVTTPGGLNDWIYGLKDTAVTFSSFGLSYDLVLFRELFHIANVPRPDKLTHFNYDISTLFQEYVGDPSAPYTPYAKERFLGLERDQKHNALFDAKVAREIYLRIKWDKRFDDHLKGKQ